MVKLTNTFSQYNKNPLVLLEGGLYGHMSHIWEDHELTFTDLSDMIDSLLSGGIESIKEKVDGQALACSMDMEGNVIFARNKGHIKNFGEKALKWEGVQETFADRGDLTNAFSFAAQDLSKALCSLDRDVQELRFGPYDAKVPKLSANGKDIVKDRNGDPVMETVKIKRWLNFEIVWPETTNVVPYNHRLIVLHNYDAFDIEGRRRESDFNDFAETIRQDLERINKLVQKRFTISTVPLMKLPQPRSFENSKESYIVRINKLRDEFRLTDENTLGDYYSVKIKNKILEAATSIGYSVSESLLDILINRWLNAVKSPSIREIEKMVPFDDDNGGSAAVTFRGWIKSTDAKDMQKKLLSDTRGEVKDMVIDLGIEVMGNLADFLALNPSESTNQIRAAIDKVIKQTEATGNAEYTRQIEKYLETIHKAGGIDKVVPSEGFTFSYRKKNGEYAVYKLVGGFSDLNNLIGFFKYKRA